LNLDELLLIFILLAAFLHFTRSWPRFASVVVLLSTGTLLVEIPRLATQPLDVFSVSLALEAGPRDFLELGVLLTGALALAILTKKDRVSLSFLYWSWVPWLIALAVNDFVVAVFAWAMGFVIHVFAMKPRNYNRASGASYFLVIVVLVTACLLLANRFVALYPLTPERTSLIQFAVFFLALGFGIAFALFPFQFWVGPMTDDAPLPTTAAILALGQPIGLFLLIGFLNQNLWLIGKSNLIELMALAGLAAIIIGGLMAAVERRAGRLLGYAAVFTFGFAFLDLSRATQEGLAYSGLEILSRALGLVILASAATIGREVESLAVRRIAQAAVMLAGFSLVGVRLGVGLSERWNALLQVAGSDQRVLALLILAHMGLLVGIIRFTRSWFVSEQTEEKAPVETGRSAARELAYRASGTFVSERNVGQGATELILVSNESSRSIGKRAAEADVMQLESEVQVLASGGNGTGDEVDAESESTGNEEEYVFEEHMREIVTSILVPLSHHLKKAARSLPSGTMAFILMAWDTWHVWMTITLLIALVCLLLFVGLVPGALFDRAVASLGHPPLVR
jgi:formate hydrogenlyase subunit 3/multisubunit Na+/H+ antiporter MnhD subunit